MWRSIKIPEMSITHRTAEGMQTREHKGLYHLPSSTSQVGAVVKLDTMSKGLEINNKDPASRLETPVL